MVTPLPGLALAAPLVKNHEHQLHSTVTSTELAVIHLMLRRLARLG